jgi:hypothetical protein
LVLFSACVALMQARAMCKPDAQEPMYSLSEVRVATPSKLAPNVELKVSPLLTYDLPDVPLSFELNLLNRSAETIYIHSPVETLTLRFNAPDSHVIEVPQNPDWLAFHPPVKGNKAAIVFKKANENGKEVTVDAGSYQIVAGGFLKIAFECERVISERILAALEKSPGKFVDVVLTTPLINLRDFADSPIMRSEPMRLPIPKPMR